MFGGTMKVAARVLDAVLESDQALSVVMLSSAEKGCGAYGRAVIDPWETIEVRFFGWPILTPGGIEERPSALAALLRLGFMFDGADWVWRKAFVPAVVPVAAHAAARALVEAWSISEPDVDRLVDVKVLDLDEAAQVACGSACARCAGSGRFD